MAKPEKEGRNYLTPSEVKKILKSTIRYNLSLPPNANDSEYLTPMIWGSPGVGKTRIVGEATREIATELAMELPLVADSPADKSPEEITGYPKPVSDESFRRLMPAKWLVPARSGRIVAFIDEIAQCGTEQLNVVRQILLGQNIGELRLAPGSTVVGASNMMEDRAGTHVMPTHVKDVLMHLWMRADRAELAAWMMREGKSPEVASFIQVHGDQWMHDLDTSAGAMACPSPRSWESVDAIYRNVGAEPHLKETMIAGRVGPGACSAFFAHVRMGKYMPDTDAILAGAKKIKLDESRTDVVYMTMCSLASKVKEGNLINMVEFLTSVSSKEYASFAMNMALTRNPKLRNAPGCRKWMIEHESGLIL